MNVQFNYIENKPKDKVRLSHCVPCDKIILRILDGDCNWISSQISDQLSQAMERNMMRKIIGRILIILGVCMWIPYLALKISGAEVTVMPFLALHLLGVVPGAILTRGETVMQWLARLLNRETDRPAT